MKIAFTIGSYRLRWFVKLGIDQLQEICPECPILVCDDPSPESADIKKLTEEAGAIYRGARARRGHFASDFQSLVSSLVFAEAAGADVAVKVSQRFVFRKPEAIESIIRTFSNPDIMLATPGQPKVGNGSKSANGFCKFTTLSDVVAIRVGAISPDELLEMYRARLRREKVPWASFIECTVDELHANRFQGRSAKIEELTNPTADPIYLRRYQANELQYKELANKHGYNGMWPLTEWGKMEGNRYLCRPLVV